MVQPTNPPIELRDLRFSYRKGEEILRIPAFRVEQGERVFLHGPSGSGKTTLLGLVAGVLSGATGHLHVLGEDFLQMPVGRRDTFRGDHIGYVFQMFNLIPYLSVEDNIALPARMSRVRRERIRANASSSGSVQKEVERLCEALGLQDLRGKPVTELSVGQQQRVAAARALLGAPELLIADEPTSALDADARQAYLDVLFKQCEAQRSSLLFVSHDAALRPLFPRSVSLAELNVTRALSTEGALP
jgi:putative ABC transport system ATP-binding protein